ncbi:dihydrolipoamide acetyltransferase family protein [Yonghaparkia sp. Root332]|uniref:dihydrolipoamide acetyltransferase family protein n=1 Tax=Yonghaparkia sp. Root332 TaxID=1736516 RepID=UPI0006FD19EA|nr:dihydrolipoamide acetyltransferase family protein [Yonghaparkia sp. Root332]KQV25559.1 hypothetical protein ASC54_00690 [Yonghaparkia sp. Root332]
MSTTIRMPEVLANVTEAAVQKWLVAPGDAVEVGQPFAEIETEKAVVEFAAETAGTVLELLVGEGDSIDVGAPIAIVGEAGEVALPASPAAAPAAEESDGAAPAAPSDPESGAPVAEVAAPAVDAAAIASSAAGAAGPVAEPTPASAPHDGARRFVSPLVRRLAREHGIDLAGVTGSGPDGRIVRRDITALLEGGAAAPAAQAPAAPTPAPAPAAAVPAAAAPAPEGVEVVRHSRMRATIARRLTESKSSVPHFYLTADCRVDALLDMRRQINAGGQVKVSVNDLVVKAVAGAFADVPEANRTWGDDGMHVHSSVDIGIAVSLEDGLVVPVVRGVEGLSVSALGARIAELAGRGREGRLTLAQLEGGSFTVSNLGMFGTQAFSAIINPPHAGILAVGAASARPVVVDGALEVGQVMTVTLSADHRAWDGALAARWLAAFVARIESPLSILA